MVESARKAKLGQAQVEYRPAKSILTQPSGYIDAFDFTLNPYSGCGFGCTYCYAAFFARTDELKDNWGKWIQVKDNALELLLKMRKKPLIDTTFYLRRVTALYQRLKKAFDLTRPRLEQFFAYLQGGLVVKTGGHTASRVVH